MEDQINMSIKIQFYYLSSNLIRKLFPFKGRQKFVLTNVDPLTLPKEEFEKRLIKLGYQLNYLSYLDEGEIVNLRKLYISAEPLYKIRQFHIRYYNNGEIRAHDELSYEEDAIAHLDGISISEIPKEEKDLLIRSIEK